MAIPFAMPRDEHPGTDLEQQLIRLLAIVSEIRTLLRLNTNNTRDETPASRRAGLRHNSSRLPTITLSLDAGRVEMVVGSAPMAGTTVTTVTTTTTTTTTSNGRDLLPGTNEHRQVDDDIDIGDTAGPAGPDTSVNAKRVAASLREMAEKLQNLHLAVSEEIGDGCGTDNSDNGNDVPDSRPLNPAESEASSATPDRQTATSSNRRSTVTTVTTFTTTRQHHHESPDTTTDSVLNKLTLAVPSVSLVMVPLAVMVGWHWFKGR